MTLEDKMKQVQIDMEAFTGPMLTLDQKRVVWDLLTECFRLSEAYMIQATQKSYEVNELIQKSNELAKQGADMLERLTAKPKPKLVIDNGEIPKETA